MYPKNYENKYTTKQCTKLCCARFGLSTFCMSTFLVGRCFDMSTFWFGLVCRRFGLSTFWSVDISVCLRFGLLEDVLVCRRFSLSTFLVCRHFGIPVFRFVDVFVVDVSVSRRFDQLPTKGSTLTHQILFINMVIILQSTYQNGFLQWHFSLSHSPCVLLLKYNLHFTLHRLYIVNIFPTFKHFNPSFSPLMRRIKYRTCFPLWYHDQPKLVPSPQYTSITLRYTIGDGKLPAVRAVTLVTLKIQMYPDGYRICILRVTIVR